MKRILLAALIATAACDSGSEPVAPAGSAPATLSLSTASDPSPNSAVVMFGKRVPDAQAVKLANDYGIRIAAVHMQGGGMTGVHRPPSPGLPEAAVDEARRESLRGMQSAMESHRARAKRFIEQHSESDVAASEALSRRGEALLATRAQVARVLAQTKERQPIVYAIEVTGDPADIAHLLERNGDAVRMRDRTGRTILPRPTLPSDADPAPEEGLGTLSASELYQRITSLSRFSN